MISLDEAIKCIDDDVNVSVPRAYFMLVAQTLANCQSLVDAFVRMKPNASAIESLLDLSEAIEASGSATLEIIRRNTSDEFYGVFLSGDLDEILEKADAAGK